ncbi:MAG: divalent cation transporter, partial [Candidatus Nitrosomaritimum yanchengensis]
MEINKKSSKGRILVSGLVPFFLLIIMIAYIFGPGSELLDLGTPLPEINLEKIEFMDSEIQVTVR